MSAMQEYRSVGAYGSVENADPHRLVYLLYNGLADALSRARGAIERADPAAKGEAIGKSADILATLRASLDHERGAEVAANLGRLYDFMELELTRANLHNDIAVLSQVAAINDTLRSAWESIPDEGRDV
jgi:flagellar protein FliS